jgi:hypothetical protein
VNSSVRILSLDWDRTLWGTHVPRSRLPPCSCSKQWRRIPVPVQTQLLVAIKYVREMSDATDCKVSFKYILISLSSFMGLLHIVREYFAVLTF